MLYHFKRPGESRSLRNKQVRVLTHACLGVSLYCSLRALFGQRFPATEPDTSLSPQYRESWRSELQETGRSFLLLPQVVMWVKKKQKNRWISCSLNTEKSTSTTFWKQTRKKTQAVCRFSSRGFWELLHRGIDLLRAMWLCHKKTNSVSCFWRFSINQFGWNN